MSPFPKRVLPTKEVEIEDREIYANAPLRFVAFEVRITPVPHFGLAEGSSRVYEALRPLLPIIGPPLHQATISIGGDVAGVPAHTISGGPLRMLDRRRQLSVVVGVNAITVETSSYEQFEAFSDFIGQALRAIEPTAAIGGMHRIGLRYVDEIRVPDVMHPADWSPYISSSLLGALALGGDLEASLMQGYAEYRVSDREQTNVRFGALAGHVVDPNGPLRLSPVDDGPFFLVDIDSFWTAPEDELPEFSTDAVLEICESLHRPIRRLFEASITEKLRNDVLRRRPGDDIS